MGEVVHVAEHARESENQVQHDQEADLRGDGPRLHVEDGVVVSGRHEHYAEQPEDRAGCTNRPDAVSEYVARDRSADPRQYVEEEQQPGAVHPLHELAGIPERVHVEKQMEDVVRVMDQDH